MFRGKCKKKKEKNLKFYFFEIFRQINIQSAISSKRRLHESLLQLFIVCISLKVNLIPTNTSKISKGKTKIYEI